MCYEHVHQISLNQAVVPCLERMRILDAIRECCAGLDVHQAHVVACVLKGPLDEKPQMLIREFSTVLSGLLQLSDWLAELGCTEVAMESTGAYWKPVFNVLESTCQITLANAAHIKNLPGRKTDKKDAQWIAELHRCGLVSPSFVAPREIRELRDLTRYRRKLKGYQTSERNRILKVLEDANIKISTFMSDVFGKSGRLMLHALVNGEVIVPEQVAELAKGRLRAKIRAHPSSKRPSHHASPQNDSALSRASRVSREEHCGFGSRDGAVLCSLSKRTRAFRDHSRRRSPSGESDSR